MLRNDADILWRPGRIYIPANHFTGMSVGAINEGGTGNFEYGEKWEGANGGAPISKEISTFGITAVLMEAAADEVDHLMMLPYDMDIERNIYVRVHWTSGSSTTADTIDWAVRYLKVVPDTTVLAAPGTALDGTIAQDTVVGEYVHQATGWGSIQPDATPIAANVEYIIWGVEMDAFAGGLIEDKFFLGLEIRYTPKRLWGVDGMRQEAKPTTTMFAKEYAS